MTTCDSVYYDSIYVSAGPYDTTEAISLAEPRVRFESHFVQEPGPPWGWVAVVVLITLLLGWIYWRSRVEKVDGGFE